MRIVHPIAWVGLFLNVALAFLLYNSLGGMDLAAMDEASRAAWEELSAILLHTVRPFHLALLLAQTAALGLMAMRVPFALGVAFIAAMLTIPGSFVYLLGCLLTHYRVKYADFAVAPAGYRGARHIFPAFALRKMQVFSLVNFSAGLFLVWRGDYMVSFTFFALTLVGLYCLYRARAIHALSLHGDHCTLNPGLFAPRLRISYADVELATLFENETIQFTIRTPDGRRSLLWPLQTVRPEQRRQAVEELGAELDACGVPLQ